MGEPNTWRMAFEQYRNATMPETLIRVVLTSTINEHVELIRWLDVKGYLRLLAQLDDPQATLSIQQADYYLRTDPIDATAATQGLPATGH